MTKNRNTLTFFALSVILNIVLFFVLIQQKGEVQSSNNFTQLQLKYPLLAKRILLDFPQDILVNFVNLRNSLRTQVKPYGNSFAFYFEYLPTGTSIGVNEKNEFHAASLFKLPVVMSYFHKKERLRDTKDLTVSVRKDQLSDEFGDLYKKRAGYKIKLSEAVRLALEDSDNTAAKIVADYTSKEDFDAVYAGLDIDLQTDQGAAILTAKNYSSILKALYFSSVLNKDDSQEILDLLTKTKFPDKLVAGVPSQVPVAHKIGDWHDDNGNGEAFSDCGVVYVPRRPYLLCMLSITDEQTARERMALVSKTIYDYVSNSQ